LLHGMAQQVTADRLYNIFCQTYRCVPTSW
jgi:hypothetical protein